MLPLVFGSVELFGSSQVVRVEIRCSRLLGSVEWFGSRLRVEFTITRIGRVVRIEIWCSGRDLVFGFTFCLSSRAQLDDECAYHAHLADPRQCSVCRISSPVNISQKRKNGTKLCREVVETRSKDVLVGY